MRRLLTILLIALTGSLLSCGGARVVEAPSAEGVVGEKMSCLAVKDPNNPYIIEWSPEDAGALELRARNGLVVVSYDGCRNLKVLSDCDVKGVYELQTLTPRRGSKRIEKVTELMAELPLAAAKLKGRIAFGHTIELKTVMSGMLQTKARPDTVPGSAECAGATHFVSALTVGSFQLLQQGNQSASGGVGVAGLGAEAGASSTATQLSGAGNPDACTAHGPGCDTPFRLRLKKLAGPAIPAPAPVVAAPVETATRAAPVRPTRDPVATPRPSTDQTSSFDFSGLNGWARKWLAPKGSIFKVVASAGARSNFHWESHATPEEVIHSRHHMVWLLKLSASPLTSAKHMFSDNLWSWLFPQVELVAFLQEEITDAPDVAGRLGLQPLLYTRVGYQLSSKSGESGVYYGLALPLFWKSKGVGIELNLTQLYLPDEPNYAPYSLTVGWVPYR